MRRVVDAAEPLAERRQADLRMELPATPSTVECDPRRVERVLRNLVVNAIEHGEGRPVDIKVVADADAVCVGVRDHGVGLRPGESALVFNRFWRADPARARTIGGTGLGLAIALEDARLHGGWLEAWGQPGDGAHFRLTLPRRAGRSWPRRRWPSSRRTPEPAGACRSASAAGQGAVMRSRGARLAVLGVAVAAVVAGCAGIPTSGPVHEAGQLNGVGDEPFSRIVAQGPAEGATPNAILTGFLAASASFDDDHLVARSFLTPDAARSWRPGSRVQVYQQVTGPSVRSPRWARTPTTSPRRWPGRWTARGRTPAPPTASR